MANHPLLIVSALCLAYLVLYGIILGGRAKRAKKMHPSYFAPALLSFVGCHAAWWGSGVRTPESVLYYLFLVQVPAVAFLCGSAFVTTGFLSVKGDTLIIDQKHVLYRLMSRLPINFAGKSLCSLSWLAAVTLFIAPVVWGTLFIALSVISGAICLVTGQNWLEYAKSVLEFDTWPVAEMQVTKHGVYKSPLLWISFASIAIGIGHMALHSHRAAWEMVLSVLSVLFFSAALLVISRALLLAAGRKIYVETDVKTIASYDLRRSIRDLSEPSSFQVIVVFWQIFQHKFCPKIQYLHDADE